MTRTSRPAGTLVLDSEGLAKAVRRDRELIGWLALARADDLRVVTSAATLVEVVHPRVKRPAFEWTLSRVVVEPVTEEIARSAAALLAEAGGHGHRYAIDSLIGRPRCLPFSGGELSVAALSMGGVLVPSAPARQRRIL
jgi:predicted nucleic acid-binding protein